MAICLAEGKGSIYFARASTFSVLLMACLALVIAIGLEDEIPDLRRPASRCTIHFQPVGLAVCSTSYSIPLWSMQR